VNIYIKIKGIDHDRQLNTNTSMYYQQQ